MNSTAKTLRVNPESPPTTIPVLPAGALLSRQAVWRSEAPTEKQLALLQRLGMPRPLNLTKGEASDLISASFVSRDVAAEVRS